MGPCIGWTDGETVYLEPESAYALAQKMAGEGGHALGVGSKTLWKRLDDAGLLSRKDKERGTTKAMIGTKRRRVIVIGASILQQSGQQGQSGHNGEKPNEFTRLSRPDSHGSAAQSSGHGSGAARPDHRDVPEEESGRGIGAEKHEEHQRVSGLSPDWPDCPDFADIERPEGADGIFQHSDSNAPLPGATPEFDLLDDMPAFLRRGNYDRGHDHGATTVRANPLKTNAGNGADGADANHPPQSAPERTGTPGWSARL